MGYSIKSVILGSVLLVSTAAAAVGVILASSTMKLTSVTTTGKIDMRKIPHQNLSQMFFFFVIGILITGGIGSGGYVFSAEFFNPITNTSLTLPASNKSHHQHTQNTFLSCGEFSCQLYVPGTGWTQGNISRTLLDWLSIIHFV